MSAPKTPKAVAAGPHPGPYTVRRDGHFVRVLAPSPHKGRRPRIVAHMGDFGDGRDGPTAALFAAAPELLAAVEAMLAAGGDDDWAWATSQAAAAVAKAKGGAA